MSSRNDWLCPNHESAGLSFLHQAFFGGTAAAGFGVLFNCPPRSLWLGFTFGALALVVRTAGQEFGGLGLPAASFIAALILAVLNRILEQPDSPRGSVLAVIGCISMIPGSLAAKGLMNLFDLMRATPGEGFASTTAAVENLMLVGFTLVAIGTALATHRSCSRLSEVMIDGQQVLLEPINITRTTTLANLKHAQGMAGIARAAWANASALYALFRRCLPRRGHPPAPERQHPDDHRCGS